MDISKYAITDRQKQVLAVAVKHGYVPGKKQRSGTVAAAKELGVHHSLIGQVLRTIERNAAKQEVFLHNAAVSGRSPEGYPIKGTSGLYGVDEVGNLDQKLIWIKNNVSLAEQLDQAKTFMDAFIQELPQFEIPDRPLDKFLCKDQIPWFNIGDGHLGMLAHEWEVGQNFDLKIAERELLAAMAIQIQRAPAAERCVIQDMGDMTHYENIGAKTDRSGHDLDYDGRFGKMIHVYARVMRQIVELALAKFKYVDVIVNQGNHSRTNDLWMAVFLRHVYEGCGDRLTVLDNNSVFIPYRMGNTFVMCHHSDMCKPAQLVHVMATDFAQDWGETTFRYIDMGHVHHRSVAKEHPGVVTESFNQLAAADKHAHDHGWRSRQCLTTLIRSKTYGEVGRFTLSIQEVWDHLARATPGTFCQSRRPVHTV